jgi:hypothetical protein
MKISTFKGIFVFLAVIFFTCCVTQNGRTDDITIWKNAESVDDFIGKWEGSINILIPRDAANVIPKSSMEVSIYFEYIKGSDEVDGAMKMDLNKFLTDMLNLSEVRRSGLTKDGLWEFFIDEFENMDNFTIGGKYYVNYDLSDRADTFFFDNTEGEILINETRDKVKLVFYEALSLGIGDEGFTEIMLYKR